MWKWTCKSKSMLVVIAMKEMHTCERETYMWQDGIHWIWWSLFFLHVFPVMI